MGIGKEYIAKAHCAQRQGTWFAEAASPTREGMARKAEKGGKPGAAPLGYVNKRQGDDAWVEVDPTMGPLVRHAFRLAASGTSVRAAATVTARLGLTGKDGKPLSSSAMGYLLRNPFYAGYVSHAGQIFPGMHEPLVDEETFGRVQNRLTERRIKYAGRFNP